jgi:hypothetical protein
MEHWSSNAKYSEESRNGANAAFEKLNKYYMRTQDSYLVAAILYPSLKLEKYLRQGFFLR